jgi:hypothetical protein
MATRSVTIAAAMLVLLLQAAHAQSPLHIARQGSLEAGGRVIACATNDGADPNSKRWPPGHVVVDNIYATYQYPVEQKSPYPILFNSGGSHTARVYAHHARRARRLADAVPAGGFCHLRG